jgi:hypothetical protein
VCIALFTEGRVGGPGWLVRGGLALGGGLVAGGCGGPLRVIAADLSVASPPLRAEVVATCTVSADERWTRVDLALENRGTEPVAWPNPAPGPAIETTEGPEGCTIRLFRSGPRVPTTTIEGVPPSVTVGPGETSHLAGGFAVVRAEGATDDGWSRLGPSVALAEGTSCALVCSSVYWPPPRGDVAPRDPRGGIVVTPDLLADLDPVVPVSIVAGELRVEDGRVRITTPER